MIDPTKPGPDADRIAELEREVAELEAANEATPTWGAAVGARWEQIKGLRAQLSALRNEQPKGPEANPGAREGLAGASRSLYTTLAQSDAGPREQQSEIIHLTSALREAESRIEALSDASGLIEAAKIAERYANVCHIRDEEIYIRKFAGLLRTRAADRSRK